MHTSQKSPDVLVQQLKDFLAHCDEDTYAYIPIYSAKNIMRALDNPYMRDVL
jgi:hypothetical protein